MFIKWVNHVAHLLIMKKITLLVASVLLVGNFAKASEIIKIADERTMNRFSFDEPISFTERGIEFFVFLNGDFDFNVVIRSLFYSAANRYLSYQTGGAITYDSLSMQEWEEMRLKSWALERIFLDMVILKSILLLKEI